MTCVCLLQCPSFFFAVRLTSHPKQLSGEPGGEGLIVPGGRERTQSSEDEDAIRRAYGLKR